MDKYDFREIKESLEEIVNALEALNDHLDSSIYYSVYKLLQKARSHIENIKIEEL